MKPLVGAVLVGPGKVYAQKLFERHARTVLREFDVLVAVDQLGRTSLKEVQFKPNDPGVFATTIVEHGKEALRQHALQNNFDALVWQGFDMFYRNRYDFEQLLKACTPDRPVVSALQAGRNRPDYPVCREFIPVETGKGMLTTVQRELPPTLLHDALRAGKIVKVRGYPGSDATVIRREVLETVSMEGYEPWVARRRHDEHALGPEEFWCWSAITRNAIVPRLHTGVRPYHLHEDGYAARYPGERVSEDEVGREW